MRHLKYRNALLDLPHLKKNIYISKADYAYLESEVKQMFLNEKDVYDLIDREFHKQDQLIENMKQGTKISDVQMAVIGNNLILMNLYKFKN